MTVTIKALLLRGDHVSVEHGRLVIIPISKKPVPDTWLAAHTPTLMREIAETTGIPICQYQRYTTGRYGNKLAAGVALTYMNIVTGQSGVTVFNAELTRARSTKAGAKGSNLPRGQFRVSALYSFVRFWNRLGLVPPRRLSEFHHYMGRLRDVFITAFIDRQGKMDKGSIEPVTIAHSYLRAAFCCAATPNNLQANHGQFPDNWQARTTDKQIPEAHALQCFQVDSSACAREYEQSKQGSANDAVAITTIDNAIPSHISDWMSQMENASKHRQQEKVSGTADRK